MDFCTNCNNMYYIKLENEDCDKIVYYCRNCGTTDDALVNVNKCILRENINVSEDKFNIHINKYTKLDITLPRINYIKCPNELCQTNESGFDSKKKEIIFMRYDDTRMKYLYLCSHCDFIWKTV
jgi:DNA-directed RNA polymerase subunit M/transcription elongation factor TFIIS